MHDTLILNARILTCNPAFEVIPAGWLRVRGALIDEIGAMPAPAGDADVIDARGGILMPGLVNTHTHLPMTLFRGLADDLPLEVWLREHIFPAEAAVLTPDTVRSGALLAGVEMLLSGTTTCADGYFHEDAVAEAVEAVGLRAVLGQGVIDLPAPGVPNPAANLDAARRFCRDWTGRCPRIRPSVFCHSPLTCSRDTLIGAKRICRELGLLFQIHAAETRAEVERIRALHQVSPVHLLDSAGLLDEHTLLAHGVWLDDADIARIAAGGARVSHNPESNMKLASGIAPVPALRAAGIPVGLGTDGCASNNDLDLFQAMDLAAKLHKVAGGDPTILPAGEVLRMATIEGARALGLAAEIGSLEPGKQADLILLDTRAPHLTPMHHPVSAIVYAAGGADVRTVLVAGRVVVRDRNVLTVDPEGIMQDVARLAARMRAGGIA
jgi:5-methylthioadenosine/S-adenosylhomocysteine deaminase